MEIKDVLNSVTQRKTVKGLAEEANVSRNTIYSIQQDLEKSSVRILRQVFRAMGYNLVLSLEKMIDNERTTND